MAKRDKSQPGNSQPSSLIGTCLTLPNLGFLWVFFKYPNISKNGNPLFFPVYNLLLIKQLRFYSPWNVKVTRLTRILYVTRQLKRCKILTLSFAKENMFRTIEKKPSGSDFQKILRINNNDKKIQFSIHININSANLGISEHSVQI